MELTRLLMEGSEIMEWETKKIVDAEPLGSPVAIDTPASGNLDSGNLFSDIPRYAERINEKIKPNAYILGASYDVYVTPTDQWDRGLRKRVFPVQFYILQD